MKKFCHNNRKLSELPLDILREVFFFLEEPFITTIGRTCKVFYIVSNDQILIRENCLRWGDVNPKWKMFKHTLKTGGAGELYTKNQANMMAKDKKTEAMFSTYFYKNINNMIKIAASKCHSGFYLKEGNSFSSYERQAKANAINFFCPRSRWISSDKYVEREKRRWFGFIKKYKEFVGVKVDMIKIYNEFSEMGYYRTSLYFTEYKKMLAEKGYHAYLCLNWSRGYFVFAMDFTNTFESQDAFVEWCKTGE
jgi:hypothetical protein